MSRLVQVSGADMSIQDIISYLNKKGLSDFFVQFLIGVTTFVIIFKFENFDQYAIASDIDGDWFPEITRDDFYNIK